MSGRFVGLSVLFLLAGIILTPPCFADWRASLTRSFVTPLVKRAAVHLIRQELYDLESGAPVISPGGKKAMTPALSLVDSPAVPARTIPVSVDRWFENRPSAGNSLAGKSVDSALASGDVAADFRNGLAGRYSYKQLVDNGALCSYPMNGGIYKRQDRLRYIILHSTETGSPADARRVIRSWSNRGAKHPGAQFVVDRDGIIYATTDPANATVHIDTSKTLPGYSNDNSIGIEIVRAGSQRYTAKQLESLTRLVVYLQDHFQIADENITTHHHVQSSDRSDPVNFDMVAFIAEKQTMAINCVMPKPAPDLARFAPIIKTAPPLSVGGARFSRF